MNTTQLLLGLIFSFIGLGYFLYGKKQKKMVPLVCGLLLMVYSYFGGVLKSMLTLNEAIIDVKEG